MIGQYAWRIFPRLLGYKLAYYNLIKPPHPIILNFSVTNKCQSQCTTCNIWQLYKKFPEKEKEELDLARIKKVFKTIKPVFLLNICGGEPFLRDDLDEICKLAAKYLKPAVIHSPTNCLAPEKIADITERILQKIPDHIHLTIKLSIDGVGKKHDKIRGVEGNFEKILQTHDLLVEIRKKYHNLYIDAGTTVSVNNLNDLKEINEFVNKRFKLDNFLHEIADTRAELFNVDVQESQLSEKKLAGVMGNLAVTPTGKNYDKVMGFLKREVLKKIKTRRKLSKITQALRIVYYQRAAKVMKTNKRVVSCYAGLSNAHLNPWGGLWICNVQAFKKEMGNVKDFKYNFDKLWKSERANQIRKWVKGNHCSCPLVGQSFLDTIMSPKELLKVFWYYVFEGK